MSRPLEEILRHRGRLDILCCLAEGRPLAAEQLSARTGQPRAAVMHQLELLEIFDLVDKLGDRGGGEPLYTLDLDRQPEWIQEAIEGHSTPTY